MKVYGRLVDLGRRDIYPAAIEIEGGSIKKIEEKGSAPDHYIMPGLIDSHIHIESSMMTPGAFASAVVKHGTTGVVSDPHEIANVLGVKGVLFMIEDAGKVPVKFWFGAPSCVPATEYENSGAVIGMKEIARLLEMEEIKYLAEMMNFPGVISGDKEVIGKINIAKGKGMKIDGHAPGLKGDELRKYIEAGIETDHECSTLEEAREKISYNMKIQVREGSAARNLESLKELYKTNPEMIMLCSDDLHPDMLVKRHINKIIAGLINDGYDKFDVIRSATVNPVSHYKLEAGLLEEGGIADFIIVDDLGEMNVIETWIEGNRVYGKGEVLFGYEPAKAVNNFNCSPIVREDIRIINAKKKIRVIKAYEGELITGEMIMLAGEGDNIDPDTERDILKIVVKDRYKDMKPATGFISGFGLKKGAFASSVAHDSHNIISVGTNDRDIILCVNEVIRNKGGLAVAYDGNTESVKLDIGGIMTTQPCNIIADEYEKLNKMVKDLGSSMTAPFMTLSFMALLVIPELKISDRGLFDVKKFNTTSLFVDR